MARSATTALSFAVLLAVLDIGSCLRCYVCSSPNDPTCGDPFNYKKPLMNCDMRDEQNFNSLYLKSILPHEYLATVTGATRYCYKLVLMNGNVVRTCLDSSPNNMNQTCVNLDFSSRNEQDPSKRLKHCSVCDKEGCNGAASVIASIPLALLVVAVTLFQCKQ